MLLVQNDDIVQATAHPAFRHAVLPRRLHTRSFGLQPRRLQEGDEIGIEFLVVVKDGVSIGTGLRKGFPQLLDDPLRGRVTDHVEVEDPTTPVFDHEETVKQLEGNRWHGEEVEHDDRLTVILQEGKPPFSRITTSMNAPQISSHGTFGDLKTELQNLSVDLGCTPACIPFRHPPDEPSNLVGDLRPTTARAGTPPPAKSKTSTMPADDGLGLHNDQDAPPTSSEAAQSAPEKAVEGIHGRTRSLAFQYSDLLSKGENLKGCVAATPEEDADGGEDGGSEFEHELPL